MSAQTIQLFSEINFPEVIQNSLTRLNLVSPTPIQAQAIPIAMQGSDLVGIANTGTGKTLAYLLPTLVKLLSQPESHALVLVPTRELALQVLKNIQSFIKQMDDLGAVLLIGGEPFGKQLRELRANPRMIIGTPGRIIDHLSRNTIDFKKVDTLIFDEMDRMFDMGFGPQVEELLKHIPQDRQTLMLSATMPPHIKSLIEKVLKNPSYVSVSTSQVPDQNIKQKVLFVQQNQKVSVLIEELQKHLESTIIFVKTKRSADDLAAELSSAMDKRVASIHGDIPQMRRLKVLRDFRNQTISVLVATDLAARGLDIKSIKNVVNFDLPQDPQDYIHRIGRTGRAGAEGEALSLVAAFDKKKWDIIQRMMNPKSAADKNAASEYDTSFRRRPSGNSSFGPRKPSSGRPFGDRDRFGGDRERRPFGDRPERSERPFGDRPERSFADRPARPFGDRPERSERPFGDRPARPFGDRSDRPARSFGDRPERSFGDRPARPFADRSDRPARPFGDRSFGDRKEGSFGSGKPQSRSFGSSDSRPSKFGGRDRNSSRSSEKFISFEK